MLLRRSSVTRLYSLAKRLVGKDILAQIFVNQANDGIRYSLAERSVCQEIRLLRYSLTKKNASTTFFCHKITFVGEEIS